MTGITGGWDTAARHQRWSKVTKSATFFRFDMAWRFSSSGTFEEHWTPPSSPQPGRNPTESRAGKAGRCMYRKLRHRKGREKNRHPKTVGEHFKKITFFFWATEAPELICIGQALRRVTCPSLGTTCVCTTWRTWSFRRFAGSFGAPDLGGLA